MKRYRIKIRSVSYAEFDRDFEDEEEADNWLSSVSEWKLNDLGNSEGWTRDSTDIEGVEEVRYY